MTEKETINTKDYPIVISSEIGKDIDKFIQGKNYSFIYLLMDENIMESCWPILSKNSEEIKNAEILLVEPGEAQKDIEIAIQLWHSLTEYEADKSSLMINFGGGVITDLGGFIASTYKRGIDFINIPTSLLAIVDASVGGKTGINLRGYKNQIGVFAQAQAVFIQTDFIKSLKQRHLINGYAEMMKHGLIADSNHWNELLKIDTIGADSIAPNIRRSIEIKSNIVEQDPLEKSTRKSLNFGHTIGHIIEAWSLQNDSNPLLHGEAVAIGIIIESYLSTKKTHLSISEFEIIKQQIDKHFSAYCISNDLLLHFEEILNQDKKKSGNEFNFTFVAKIGKFVINQSCSIEDIKDALIYYKENYPCHTL